MSELPKNLPIKFEMLPKNRQIEIVFSYEDKFDYYELGWSNNVHVKHVWMKFRN